MMNLAYALPVWIVVKSTVFRMAGLDRGWWRYVSIHDLTRLGIGNLTGSLLAAVVIRWIAPSGFPRSIYVLDLLLCFLLIAGVRVAARVVAEASKFNGTAGKKRTLIYGAGDAGVLLLQEIQHNPNLPYEVAGFLDDNPQKARLTFYGVKVLGSGANLGATVKRHRIDTILIALPSASGVQMTRILRLCQDAGVSFKTVPGLGEILEGNGLARHIRDVAVEDLLGRSPTLLDQNEIGRKLRGQGGAGDGGGGLHRLGAMPADCAIRAESDRGLRDRGDGAVRTGPGDAGGVPGRVVPRGDRQHAEPDGGWARCSTVQAVGPVSRRRLQARSDDGSAHVRGGREQRASERTRWQWRRPSTGSTDFVMISSDKAVRPTNVMGVSKRLAELAVTVDAERADRVMFRCASAMCWAATAAWSRCSRGRLRAGGPVTVTHPEMRRYFMTIPEAAQLVLQASPWAKAGRFSCWTWGSRCELWIWRGT